MSEPAQPSSVSVREATCEEVCDIGAGPALLSVGARGDLQICNQKSVTVVSTGTISLV